MPSLPFDTYYIIRILCRYGLKIKNGRNIFHLIQLSKFLKLWKNIFVFLSFFCPKERSQQAGALSYTTTDFPAFPISPERGYGSCSADSTAPQPATGQLCSVSVSR